MEHTTTDEPMLRTLAPALRELEKSLRKWLEEPRHYPISTIDKANFEGLSQDLQRKADALEMERPLLVIMLMGGTGVGKSTLLNALAGGTPIAQASFARPTTRDPVVYYHESVQPARLDPVLHSCRMAQHDRPELKDKILVDTPDIDSNDLANRETLMKVLPVADVVLYVGSQEKYHDKLVWDVFQSQRKRRAFAFILNKWDRCIRPETGIRPDEDLLRDLESEGFKNPLLFRTCAQHWVDQAEGNSTGEELPEGEQFQDLLNWLEAGLSLLEIEAIKARGVGQLLQQTNVAFNKVMPPDLTKQTEAVRQSWKSILRQEADACSDVLLNTLTPYRKEIEHHFALQRQSHFRGLMGGYLALFNKIKYAGSNLKGRVSIMPQLPQPEQKESQPTSWDLAAFTRSCSQLASEQHLDARSQALSNRLLLNADEQGFPLSLLSGHVEKAAKVDWRQHYSQALIDILNDIETSWTKPTGWRGWMRFFIVVLTDWIPLLAFLVALALPLYYLVFEQTIPELFHFIMPFFVLLLTLVLLHIVIAVLLPLKWDAIRGQLESMLESRMRADLEDVYNAVPGDVLEVLQKERRRIQGLLGEVKEVTDWLAQREQAATVKGLYGHQ